MATPTGSPVTGAVSSVPATITDFSFTGGGPQLAAGPNPNRLYLLVLFTTTSGRVMPAPASTTYGMGPDVNVAGGGRLIHRAAYPGLIGGEWFVYDAGVSSIRVYDVDRE